MLRQCLDTIAAQTYPALEVIVVDDASEGDIPAVINAIPWPSNLGPQYIRLEQNRGPGAAREVGRKQAQGDFICYLDSDDLWHRDKVAMQVEVLQNHSAAGMCYCISVRFKGAPLTGEEPVSRLSDRPFTSILPQLLYSRPWDTSACMWTRRATDRIGPWWAGWTWEDVEYDLRAGCLDLADSPFFRRVN